MKRFVTFGEIMGRMAAPGMLRIRQALPGSLDVTFAGAEANVAASLAMLGADASFVTALPDNPLADACLANLRGLGIDTSHVLTRDTGRLGLYFLETGANQRPGRVIYDREHSAVSLTPANAYDWPAILHGAAWLHVTGVTPAISRLAAEATIAAVKEAANRGVAVSFDVNFRAKLWRWDAATPPRELAGRVLRDLLPHVTLLIAGPGDSDLLGLERTPPTAGPPQPAAYADFARKVVKRFPNVHRVAATLRASHSASHNDLGAMLYDADNDQAEFAPTRDGAYQPYEVRNMVDRVGGGDAFAAALLFALASDDDKTGRDALDFAAAAFCLAHSIVGDFNFASRAEIDALRSGSTSGRVVR